MKNTRSVALKRASMVVTTNLMLVVVALVP
jgi:hypothetical protein